jgi:multidrug resistance protein
VKNRSALGILFVIVFIDLLGFGMVIPVMALYAERLGASPSETGWLMASYSLMQFVFAPFWGRLSDRYGRRPLLLASIALTSVAFLMYALAPTFGWLLAARLFAGIATANIGIAMAYVADVTAPAERAKGMGIIGAAFGLGFVLGPWIGGELSHAYGLPAPGYAAAALAAANTVAAWFILREPATRTVAARRSRLAALAAELRKPGVRRLIWIYLLVVFAFAGMESTFALLSEHRYGLSPRGVGRVFAFIGVVMVVVQGGLIGPLTRRFGERGLLVAGLLLQAAGLAALPFMPGVAGLFGATFPLAVGNGLANPSMSSLLSRSAAAEDQGETLGIGQSASALGRVLGPLGGTYVFGELWMAGPYVGGALVMVAMAAVAATLRAPQDASAPAPALRGEEA